LSWTQCPALALGLTRIYAKHTTHGTHVRIAKKSRTSIAASPSTRMHPDHLAPI
jgi:hypothetical protein